MHQTLILCGQRVLGKLYFMPDVLEANCLSQGPEPPAKPAPKAANPRTKPSTKSAAKPAAQMAAQPAAGEPIPVAPVKHVQLVRVKILPPQKVANRAFLLVKLKYPNRQFLAHFVVHRPLCLHVLFRVAGPLHSIFGGKGISLRGARILSRAGHYYARGRGGSSRTMTITGALGAGPLTLTAWEAWKWAEGYWQRRWNEWFSGRHWVHANTEFRLLDMKWSWLCTMAIGWIASVAADFCPRVLQYNVYEGQV